MYSPETLWMYVDNNWSYVADDPDNDSWTGHIFCSASENTVFGSKPMSPVSLTLTPTHGCLLLTWITFHKHIYRMQAEYISTWQEFTIFHPWGTWLQGSLFTYLRIFFNFLLVEDTDDFIWCSHNLDASLLHYKTEHLQILIKSTWPSMLPYLQIITRLNTFSKLSLHDNLYIIVW